MNFILLIGSFIYMQQSVFALEGPSTGGGGFVVSCSANILEPASLQMLEMYEGKLVMGFSMAQASGDLVQDYLAAVDRTYSMQGYPNLAEELQEDIKENLKKFARVIKFVETPQQLPMANDLGRLPYIPSSCRVQQIAFFADHETTVYVRRDLWNQLDSANQVALILHELFYSHERKLNEVTSESTRRLVAHMMAVSGPIPIKEGIPADAPTFSTSDHSASKSNLTSSFWAVQMTGGGEKVLKLQFSQIFGRPQLTATWAYVPFFDWDLKFASYPAGSSQHRCILQTPNLEGEITSPLSGTMMSGYSISIKYRTGEPITLSLKQGHRVLAQGPVGAGPECR